MSSQYRPWQFARKRETAPWMRAVLAYACPDCTSGPGVRCHSASGRFKTEPHAARSRLASANGWKDPEDAQP